MSAKCAFPAQVGFSQLSSGPLPAEAEEGPQFFVDLRPVGYANLDPNGRERATFTTTASLFQFNWSLRLQHTQEHITRGKKSQKTHYELAIRKTHGIFHLLSSSNGS